MKDMSTVTSNLSLCDGITRKKETNTKRMERHLHDLRTTLRHSINFLVKSFIVFAVF